MGELRAALYLRNSDPRQARAGTHDGQLDAGRKAAERLGASVVAVYADEGLSAKTGALGRRGDFARLLIDAGAKQFDVVIVANVDRLTRTESFAELGAIWGPLQDAGVRVATSSGQVLDLSSREGQLLAMFESWRSAGENAARRGRTITGRDRVARAGRPPGRPPWGYAYAEGGWRFTPAAEVVREMYRRILAGESCNAVAVDLHHRGIEGPRNGRWARSRVYDVVVREAYRGTWRANHDTVIQLPPLVDEATWFAAQAALQRGKTRGLRRTRHSYLLEGFLVCGLCGGRINIKLTTEASGEARRYYHCPRRYRAPYGERCDLPLFRTGPLDAGAWERVRATLADPNLVAEVMGRRAGAADSARWAEDLRAAEASLAQLDTAEAAILDRYSAGKITQGAFDAALERNGARRRMLEQQAAAARQALGGAQVAQADVATLTAAVERLRRRLTAAAPERRRGLVQALVSGAPLVLGPEGLSGRLVVAEAPAGTVAVPFLVAV